MAGIEQEDAIVQQFLRRQPLAIVFALNEPRQHVALGVAGFCAPPLDEDLEIAKKILHRIVAARKYLRLITGSSAPRMASDQSRNGSRSSWGTSSRLPITSIGMADGKIVDQVDVVLCGEAVEQAVDQPDQIGLHRCDRARRQRAHDQPPHPGVGGGIVEDEAGGVVFVEQVSPYFGANSFFLSDEKTLVAL